MRTKPRKLDTLAKADGLTTSMSTLADLAPASMGDQPSDGSTDIWDDVDELIIAAKNIPAIKAIMERMRVPLRLAIDLRHNRFLRPRAARPEAFGQPPDCDGRSAHT